MAETVDAIRELSALLAQVGARPILVRERIAPSTFYDVDYHLAIVACAFAIHSKSDAIGRKHVLASWLKLLQFVAARPRLAPDLRVWAESRHDADLDTWRRMPRGYIGDRTHDGVIEFLIAANVLARDKDELLEGTRVGMLNGLYDRVRTKDLFATERGVLENLRTVRTTKAKMRGS